MHGMILVLRVRVRVGVRVGVRVRVRVRVLDKMANGRKPCRSETLPGSKEGAEAWEEFIKRSFRMHV